MSKMIGATTQHTANPTGLKAGYKVNVIPQTATAEIDGRFLPGREEEFFAEIDRLLGTAVSREFIHHDIALETTRGRRPVGRDVGGAAAPRTRTRRWSRTACPAGTDAKCSRKLGIRCFGFSPLRLPPELDFSGMFHGIDERVPVDGLRFGVAGARPAAGHLLGPKRTVSKRPYGAYYPTAEGSLPAAVGVQPEPGQLPRSVLGVIREDAPRGVA